MQALLSEAIIETPIGLLQLSAQKNRLMGIRFSTQQASVSSLNEINPFLQTVILQLQNYFKSAAQSFSLSLEVEGTPFQKKVWDLLQAIPKGQTRTYGELANQLKTSPRAVGNACRQNPFLVVIPCHRVTAKNGLGGFFGAKQGHFLNIKTWLLQHESSQLPYVE